MGGTAGTDQGSGPHRVPEKFPVPAVKVRAVACPCAGEDVRPPNPHTHLVVLSAEVALLDHGDEPAADSS